MKMGKLKVPDTYVIIFFVLLICAAATWFVPGAVPQTWQVFSAMYEGFSQQSGIIAFVLIVGGAFWVVNSTKALDAGILKFLQKASRLERYAIIRRLGFGRIVIVLIMLLFGLFGAVFGMSEETIAFVAVVIPIARSLGYDELIAVCMVYVAAHVGFAGAMLNPFTVGIAQEMSGLQLFSGLEYRTICWGILMFGAIVFVLLQTGKSRGHLVAVAQADEGTVTAHEDNDDLSKTSAWVSFGVILCALLLFSWFYASSCVIKIGQSSFSTPWLLWVLDAVFAVSSMVALRRSRQMYILGLLLHTIVFMVVGVMGYSWYLPEICALFMALAVASGVAAGYSADNIAKEFVAGARDIFSAALIIGFAAGITSDF